MPDECHFFLNQLDRPGFSLDRKFNRIFKNENPLEFHKNIRNYTPSPLISLSKLAKNLGVKELYLKDESVRFRQNTFKTLGASYAIHKLSETLEGRVTFCTATDGNHGRSVAWAARNARHKAVIYVPTRTAAARIRNIKKLRAKVVLVEGDYDAAVQKASEDAEKMGYVLVQDTSWVGYTQIPTYIAAGYKTLLMEMEDSLHPPGKPEIDFVFLQTGVGALASSVVAYYRNRYPRKMPRIVAVEPSDSDSMLESCRQSSLAKTKKSQQTIMAGLNCGTPSLLAWNILKDGVDLFLTIPDAYAVKAMQNLYFPFKSDKQIFAGESGAAGLGGLMALASDPSLREAREKIGLGPSSRVLVFNTEGVTDPDNFDEVISKELEI